MPDRIPVFRPAHAQPRLSAALRGYDARWQRHRLEFIGWWLQQHGPFCGACGKALDFAHMETIHVDHIAGHRGQDDPKFWEYANLQCLHQACHAEKTRRET